MVHHHSQTYTNVKSCRVDLQVASGLSRRALFPLIHGMEDVKLPRTVVDESVQYTLLHNASVGQKSQSLETVFILLRQAVLCRHYGLGTPNEIRIILNVAEIEILDQLQDDFQTLEQQPFRILVLAFHLFLYAVMRQLPWDGTMINLLLDRLHEAVEKYNVNILVWQNHIPVLLWVFFVGSVVSQKDNSGKGLWFSEQFDVLCGLLHLENKLQIERQLQCFVWDEKVFRPFLDKWRDQTLVLLDNGINQG